jgi:hypothetical protein
MFSLIRSGDTMTLRYQVSPLRRIFLIAAGIAGMGAGAFATADSARTGVAILIPALLCIALMAYWLISDANTTTVFDLARRRLSVHRERPWFGPPRSFVFDEAAALGAINRSGETTDSWEARLDLRDGSRFLLGSESEGRNERIRDYLAEIRHATGIAGT